MQVVVLLVACAVGIEFPIFVSGISIEIHSRADESQSKRNYDKRFRLKRETDEDIDERPQDSDIKCGAPPVVENASVSGYLKSSYPVESKVEYICEFGFIAHGSDKSSRCLLAERGQHAEWTEPQITCIPRSCGDPGFVANGRRIGSVFTFPSRVYFECEEGYQLQGLSFRFCQTDGKWSGRLPTCKVISCPPPLDPENGRATYDLLEYGSELEYSCEEGYVLSNRQTRICSANGIWSGDEPSCLEAQCERPNTPEYGTVEVIGDKIKAGSLASYSCNADRVMVGSAVSKCLDTGEWTFPTPKCMEPCYIMAVSNGRIGRYVPGRRQTLNFKEIPVNTRVKDDESLFLICSQGYDPLGSPANWQAKVTCSKGKWSVVPFCESASCKTEPPATANARISSVVYKHGGTVLYICDPDFVKTKYGNVTCDHGVWKGVTPVCTDTRCAVDTLSFPGLLRPSKNFYRNGESFVPKCSKRFAVAKPENSNLLCKNGQWEGHMPPCMADSCSEKPPSPAHGKVKSYSELHSSIVTYACDEFFILRGDSDITCLFGEWKGRLPECVDSRCYAKDLKQKKGLAIQDIEVTQSGYLMDVRCLNGYHVGQVKPLCNSGKWAERSVSPCIEDTCSVSRIQNGAITERKTVKGPYFWSSSRIVYEAVAIGAVPPRNYQLFISCNDGYSLQGKRNNHVHIYCQEGRWRPHPVCLIHGTHYVETTAVRTSSRVAATKQEEEKKVKKETTESTVFTTAIESHASTSDNTETLDQDTCFCEFPVRDEQLQAFVGNEKLGLKSKVKKGQTVKFHCLDLGFYRLVGESELKCEECGAWHSSDMPSCADPQQGDAIIVFDQNVNITHDGVLQIEKGQVARLICLSNAVKSFPTWEVPAGSNVTIYSERLVNDDGEHYISNLDIVDAKPENGGKYSCFSGNLRQRFVTLRIKDSTHLQVECPRFEEDNEIRIEYKGSFEINTTATFSCKLRGRQLEGTKILTCLASGNWSQDPPECVDITCPELKETDGMLISYKDGIRFDSIATFHCFLPRVRTGVSRTKCLENGQWSDQPPTCSLPRCSLESLFSVVPEGVMPNVEDVKNDTVAYGDVVRLTCEEGPPLSGDLKAKCGNDGQWEVPELMRSRVPGCTLSRGSKDSQLIIEPEKDVYKFGELVSFSCPPGLRLSSEIERIMCLRCGWSDSVVPECTA